jgi:hypothetical protein
MYTHILIPTADAGPAVLAATPGGRMCGDYAFIARHQRLDAHGSCLLRAGLRFAVGKLLRHPLRDLVLTRSPPHPCLSLQNEGSLNGWLARMGARKG